MPFMASSDQIIRGKQWPDMARWGNDNNTWNVDMAAQTTYKDIQRVSEGARCMRKKTSKPSKGHGMEGRSKCALKEQGWTSNERQTSQILVQAVKGNACNTGNTTKKSKNIAPQCRPTSFMCGSSLAMVSRLSRSSHVVRLILQWFYHALSIYCKIHLSSFYPNMLPYVTLLSFCFIESIEPSMLCHSPTHCSEVSTTKLIWASPWILGMTSSVGCQSQNISECLGPSDI